MTALRPEDFRNLLDCLGEIYACHNLDSFAPHLLAALGRTLLGDYLVYNEINLPRKRIQGVSWPLGLISWPDGSEKNRFFAEHPMVKHLERTGDMPALRLSDLVSRRCYRESALYRESFRHLGVEYQLGCSVPRPSQQRAVAICVVRQTRDFEDRQILALELLRPHFLQAYRNAETISLLREEALLARCALEHSRQGVITLSGKGTVRFCTLSARHWLVEYFGKPPREGGPLPEPLRDWLRLQQLPASRSGKLPAVRRPLAVDRQGRQLIVRLLAQPGGEPMLLLEERRTELSAIPLQRLGLTTREAEVLLWVAQGKTNSDVGVILGLSSGTVHKHLEHIFEKLGVETRTTAAARALELLADRDSPDA